MRYLLLVLCLAGCATTYSETLQADGKTWRVYVRKLGDCNGYSNSGDCVAKLRPLIEGRGAELCGAAPESVMACGKTEDPQGFAAMACHVRCPAH